MKRLFAALLLLVGAMAPAQQLIVTTPGNADTAPAAATKINANFIQAFSNIAALNTVGKAVNVTGAFYGVSPSNSSFYNASALQSAVNAAITANVPLYIPASSTCYNYTPPLIINGNLTIFGDYVADNWGASSYNAASIPTGSPPLQGSVLCPVSNGSDAIDITGTGPNVNISNIGIYFQTPFVGTGNGIKAAPPYTNAANEQGLSGSVWSNVKVYGHDGNHYAFNIQNPFYDHLNYLNSYGGGALNLYGTSYDNIEYGNTDITGLYGEVIVGGTANGLNLSAAQSNALQILTFIRPQLFVQTLSGLSPSGNPPTSAQYTWKMDSNEFYIRAIALDLETTVSSPALLLSGTGNEYDIANGIFSSLSPSGVAGATTTIAAQSAGGGNANGGTINLRPGALSGTGTVNGPVQITALGTTGNSVLNIATNSLSANSQAEVQWQSVGSLAFTLGFCNCSPNQLYLNDQAGGRNVFQVGANGAFQIMPGGGNTVIGTSGTTASFLAAIVPDASSPAASGVSIYSPFGTGVGLAANGTAQFIAYSGVLYDYAASTSLGTAMSVSGCGATTVHGGPDTVSFVAASATGGTCTFALTPGNSPTSSYGWYCDGNDVTKVTKLAQSADSTTGCSIQGTVSANDFITVHMHGH